MSTSSPSGRMFSELYSAWYGKYFIIPGNQIAYFGRVPVGLNWWLDAILRCVLFTKKNNELRAKRQLGHY
jgi:hypothetical protein